MRERLDDVVPLAEHFIEQYQSGTPVTLSKSAEQKLLNHGLGKHRELANCIHRACILFLVKKSAYRYAFDALVDSDSLGAAASGRLFRKI